MIFILSFLLVCYCIVKFTRIHPHQNVDWNYNVVTFYVHSLLHLSLNKVLILNGRMQKTFLKMRILVMEYNKSEKRKWYWENAKWDYFNQGETIMLYATVSRICSVVLNLKWINAFPPESLVIFLILSRINCILQREARGT